MDVINEMRAKYAGHAAVLAKLESILATLPAQLQAAEEEFTQRAARRAEMVQQKTAFITYFLNANPIYFVPTSGMFVLYSDQHYAQVSEDDVTHMIFKNISVNSALCKWKYKIKMALVKRIRGTPLSEATPNAMTCKSVARSLQTVFGNKAYAKYFLAVLGDMIWGRRKLVYYADESFKPLLHLVARDVSTILNKNILEDFKHRYASHEFSKCRLLPGKAPERLPDINPFDMIAVAGFYFKKHAGADAYLEACPDTNLRDKALFIARNTPKSLVEGFLKDATTGGGGMPFKDVLFLWRAHLTELQLPTMVSRVELKNMLTEMGHYVDSSETCPGLAPIVPPSKLNFAHFWRRHVTLDTGGWFDAGEITQVYNSWCESKNLRAVPDEIKEWATEHGQGERWRVKCSLWNKEADVENALEEFKLQGNQGSMSYDFYCQYTKKHRKMVASYAFFEAYFLNL